MGNTAHIRRKFNLNHDSSSAESFSFPKLGVKLSFVEEFIEFCNGRQRFDDLTTTDVCENFIKPLTSDAKCSFCEMLEHSNHPAVGVATVFISHAWKYRFLDVIEALQYHFKDSPDIVIWFDLFSNNQHKAISLDFNWWSNTFKTAIAQFGRTVMVLAPWNNPIPLTRAWCLFEIYCTIDTKGQFEIALSKNQQKHFFEDMITYGDLKINEMLATIHVEKSECFKREDKQKIFEVVEKTVGFGSVNAMLFAKFRDWVIVITQSAITEAIKNQQAYEEIQLKNTLAVLYNQQGEYDLSEALYEECLEKRKQVQGVMHPETLIALNDLAMVYDTQGKYTLAEKYYKEYIQKWKESHNSNQEIAQGSPNNDRHGEMILAMNNLAVTLQHQHKEIEAEQLWEECIAQGKDLLSSHHPTVLSAMNNVGAFYCHLGRFLDAKRMLLEAYEQRKHHLGVDHPETLNTLHNLGILYQKMGLWLKAETCWEECFDKRKRLFGAEHPDTLATWIQLSELQEMQGNDDGKIEAEGENVSSRIMPRMEKCASVMGAFRVIDDDGGDAAADDWVGERVGRSISTDSMIENV